MLTNADRTDRELLLVVADCSALTKYTTSAEVASALGIRGRNGRSAAGRVSSRLGYMKRKGLLGKVDPESVGHDGSETLWAVTPFGAEIMTGTLPRDASRVIDRASPGSAVMIMRKLTRRAYVEASEELATVVRREYQHNVAQRGRP